MTVCVFIMVSVVSGQWADALHLYGGSDTPALHESPAALQAGLGKSKAKGVNPNRKSGVGPLKRQLMQSSRGQDVMPFPAWL